MVACYELGSCHAYRLLADTVSQVTGWRLLVLDYRLAPEHPFPAAVEKEHFQKLICKMALMQMNF